MGAIAEETKRKAKHEAQQLLELFLYLGFFFCALTAYDALLLREYNVKYLNFGFALLNALVITKVIMIGEYAKAGKRHEDKPLWVSILWKAFVFGCLVFAFHVVEEVLKRLIHGADMASASSDVRFDNLAARGIVVFCVFIPLFAFREFRLVMGEDEFQALLTGTRRKDS